MGVATGVDVGAAAVGVGGSVNVAPGEGDGMALLT
jgi:hypothetical protein